MPRVESLATWAMCKRVAPGVQESIAVCCMIAQWRGVLGMSSDLTGVCKRDMPQVGARTVNWVVWVTQEGKSSAVWAVYKRDAPRVQD